MDGALAIPALWGLPSPAANPRGGWRTGREADLVPPHESPSDPFSPTGPASLACVPGRAGGVTEAADAALSALMAAAQGGDQRAYQALLRACLPHIAATVRRQGVGPDRHDDVVQEVLLTIHRARATYDPMRPFLPWLRAIAQRRAIDALRQTGRTARREISDETAYLAHPDDGPDSTRGLERSDDSRLLAEAIAQLPPGQRQAIELLALQERTLDEASDATGRTKGALKVNLHRAIQALRQRIREGGHD